MKIGFMTNYFYPATGGMEELNFNLAKELVKQGHEVHVFSSDRKDGKIFKKEENVKGVRIHRSRLWFKYKYYLKFNPGIAFKHLKYKLDVLHFQSIGFIFQDIAVILRRIFTKTMILDTPHGPFMALDKYPWWQTILRNIYVTIEYPINKLYHKSVQDNPEQYPWMEKYGFRKDKITFIPPCLPNNIYDKAQGSELKNKLKGKFVISYLGRVQEYKGLEQVVRVLPDLIKINPNVVFLAMGGEVAGEYNRLKKIAKELNVENHLIIAGRVSDDEKLQGLDASEIFILPSEWEAFGIVLVEGMARKCAVVSTKTEGGKFLVSEKEGFSYDYKDLDQLKKCLSKLIKDEKLRDKLKEHNFKKAETFLVKNLVKDFERLYAEK